MASYNVHAGHCPQGKGASGAVGLLKESVENRIVKNEVIAQLRNAGQTAYDCTCDEKTTQNGCLKKIVQKCNAHSVALDVSIHLNSGGGKGVEVLVYKSSGTAYNSAVKIADAISKALGIPNRGVKVRTNLYVLKKTKAPAVLVECCFVDSQSDYKAWNAKKCGQAIASAIVGKAVSGGTSKPTAQPIKPSSGQATTVKDNWVAQLQTECNKQGYSKQKVDGIPGKNTLAGCPTLGKKSKGNITKLLQERLNALGYNCGKADGINGTKTQMAIKAFQKAKGLTADGIVGQNTWRKLLGL